MNADRTLELLQGLDPAIQQQAWSFVAAARDAGIPLVIISGRRTYGANMDAGGAQRSLHLDGLAFDVAVWGFSRDKIPYWWWEQLGTWAEVNLGLRWGGRFLHAGRPDVNHFDAAFMTA